MALVSADCESRRRAADGDGRAFDGASRDVIADDLGFGYARQTRGSGFGYAGRTRGSEELRAVGRPAQRGNPSGVLPEVPPGIPGEVNDEKVPPGRHGDQRAVW